MMSNSNIANTAVSTFEILKKLSEKDCLQRDLLSGFTDDTLRLYINSMKQCGIRISSPSKAKKEYSLVENLDFLNFSSQDYKNLLNVKKMFSQKDNYKKIVEFNNFILLLSKYTDLSGKEKLLKILEAVPFSYRMHDMISEIEEAISASKLLLTEYTSPHSATNYFKILPKYLKIQNHKIYLYGVDISIKEMKYLPLSRIKTLKITDEPINFCDVKKYAICEFNLLKNDIKKFENVEILKKTTKKIIAKVYYENNFEFIQKVLSCAMDCIIIEPLSEREKIAECLEKTGALYAK